MTEEKKQIIVGLFSPYLYQNMGDRFDEEYLKMQIDDFGHDPNNFNGKKHIITENYKIKLDSPDDFLSEGPRDLAFSVHGSTESAEDRVRDLRGSGLIAARYSIFYGGASQYTGNYPEESGYALDLPKNMDTVKAFLTSDLMLDALVAREESRIKEAVETLNSNLEAPVLITSYLAKALRYEK
jgi:hypothetical protein